MAKRIDRKRIAARAEVMNDAWKEGAPAVEFMGITQTVMRGKMTAIDAKTQIVDDLRAQIKMADDELDDMYGDLDDTMVDVGSGVRGDKNFGDDSPLYGAMGFKRKSERASGLTRKKKVTPTGNA